MRRILFWAVGVPLIVALLGVGAFVGYVLYLSWQSPSIDDLQPRPERQNSVVYAATGERLGFIPSEELRDEVPHSLIPDRVRQAVVAVEDRRFYDHAGVDFVGLGGAIKDRLVGGRLRGASTITMQLAGNLFPEDIDRNDRTLTRKIKEAKIARAIESRYTKGKILELYLNQIALGNGAFGVETAAQRYFGKSVRDLNVAEAATLAALPKGPERYNPRRFPDRAIQRRNTIIELMRHEGAISEADARLAEGYPLQLARKSEAGEVAPYFVEWVRQQLDQQFGRQLYEQGL
jgi:penicillin-binding protein 1A